MAIGRGSCNNLTALEIATWIEMGKTILEEEFRLPNNIDPSFIDAMIEI